MKSRIFLTCVLLCTLVLVVSACGSSSESGSNGFEEVTQSTKGKNFGNEPKTAPGFDGETISLGVISPLSGLPGILGKTITSGSQTYWDAKNDKGGVAGKYKVELLSEDSAKGGTYDKTLSVKAYDKLSKKVVAFQQVLGTDVINSLNEKLNDDSMLVSPATLSGDWVRNPLVLPITNSYQTQAINGVDYYVQNFKGKNPKICSLVLDDSYGDASTEGLNFVLDKLKLKLAKEEKFTSNSPIATQVNSLVDAKCNAVVVGATAIDVASIVGAFAEKNADITLIGLSPLWIPEVNLRLTSDAKQYAAKNLWIVSAGAKWGDESVPGMSKMISDINTFKPGQASNPFFAYGYTQAWAMDQVLEKAAENGDLSSSGVARALSNVGTFDFGGLFPSYKFGPNAKSRVSPPENTIFKYDASDASKLSPIDKNATDFESKFASEFKY